MKIPQKEHAKLKFEDDVMFMLDRLVLDMKSDLDAPSVVLGQQYALTDLPPIFAMPRDDGTNADGQLYFTAEAIDNIHDLCPIDITTVQRNSINADWDSLLVLDTKTVSRKYMRRVAHKTGRANARQRCVFIERGKVSADEWHAIAVGNRWLPARTDLNKTFATSVHNRMCMAQSVQLTLGYVWGVEVSLPGTCRLIMPIQPQGIKRMFDDRDKKAYQDRRSPIKHIVREHVRMTNKGDYTEVMQHLRGQGAFTWRGYSVRVCPPKHEYVNV